MRALVVAGLALAGLALAGCSQVDALAPVGGDTLAEVRFAANDVLLGQGVAILVAPVCQAAGGTVTCRGTTVGGEEIAVSATGGTLEVAVGGRALYSGQVDEVINANARPQP